MTDEPMEAPASPDPLAQDGPRKEPYSPAPNPPFPVNLKAIELLEQALIKARTGELNAVGLSWIGATGTVGWSWHFGTQPQPMLLAGTACLARDVLDSATGRLTATTPPPGTTTQ
jgi:hypothetical protein